MTSPTFTQDDIDKLKAAVASGVLSVRYDGPPGRTVVYQDLAAMRSLLASMQQEVKAAPVYRLAATRKGL